MSHLFLVYFVDVSLDQLVVFVLVHSLFVSRSEKSIAYPFSL